MKRSLTGRALSLLAVPPLTVMAFSMTAVTAGPALADRCEPDEIVLRLVLKNYESPVDDLADTCGLVFDPLVYSTIQCDDDSTFMRCVNTAAPDPGPDPL